MPYNNQKYISTDRVTAVTGLVGVNIPGPSGIFTALTVVWNYTSKHPENAASTVSVMGYPGNVFDDGTGEAGGLRTFLPGAQPYLWEPGPIDIRQGGWLGYAFRMDVSVVPDNIPPDAGEAEFTLMFTALDSTEPTDFPGVNPPPAPDVPSITPNPPNEDGIVEIDWESNASLVTDEDGFVIERAKEGGEFPWDIAGAVPRNPTTFPNYTFTDNIKDNGFDEGPGNYKYRIRSYKLDTPGGPSLSPPSPETPTIPYNPNTSTFVMIGDLTLDMDWQSTMQFITNPSGIYTPISGQKFDRLYNRGGDPYVDVAIPTFGKIGPIK